MTLRPAYLRTILAFILASSLAACGPAPTMPVDPKVAPRQVDAAALQGPGLSDRLRAFYAARNGRPGWTGATSTQLQDAIQDMERHAIDGRQFAAMLVGDEPTKRELTLTQVALAYGDALSHGLADPKTVFDIYALDRNEGNIDQSLNEALDRGDLRDWLASLAPQDPEYAALSNAYVAYLKAAQLPQPAAIGDGKPIKPGGKDPRVDQIARTLIADGLVAAGANDDAFGVYNPTLVEAIKRFQNQQGINDDGVIGSDAVQMLNAGPTDRARQIALNLEARRWLRRDPPATRIEVNTASAILSYYKDGKLADTRRVVVGKPDAATPLLSAGFARLMVNPPWNVPDGIAAKEVLPKGQAYLQSHDMYVQQGHVIQRPGPKASLGLVKFDLVDKYAMYLHDTPSKAAFKANERHASHGCIRVDDAVGFARKLASERGRAADFDAKLAKGETAPVALGAAIPVQLAYHTVFVDEQGKVVFRPDIYGWDEMLATALHMPVPVKRAVATGAADLGP